MPQRFLRLLVALCLTLAGIGLSTAGAQAAPGQDRVRVIVLLHTLADADSVAASVQGADKVKKTRFSPYLIMEMPRAALAGLRRNPKVVQVEEDHAEAPSLASALPVINGDDVHALGQTGAGATVAILDTGIDTDHPFFGAGGSRIVAQHCFSSDDGTAQDTLCPDGTDEDTSADATTAMCLNGGNMCTHGSHVAGIAAGSQASDPSNAPGDGVGPGASIIAVQVFTRFNTMAGCSPSAAPCVKSFPSDQILALDWVRGQASANPGWNVVASNMSLGGGQNSSACDSNIRKTAIDNNLSAGIATVISAGNDGYLNEVGAPGCISTAFTVGSTDDDDTVSSFSNRGTLVDVMAPGNDIDSAIPDDDYGSMSGTSMAAPMVTGALAVLRSAAPTRSITDLMNDITSTGVPITYSIGGGNNTTTPRLDLLAAFNSASPNQSPTVTVTNATVTVDEGSEATNSGTASDPDGTIASVSASIGTATLTSGGWTWSYTPPDGPATVTVTITVTDNRGATASATFTLQVNNVAPTVVIDSISEADENGVTTVEAHFSDPGDDSHTVAVDWGTTEGTQLSVDRTGNDITAKYRYGDNGSYPVKVTVTDSDGADGDDSGTASVANVDPDAAITGPASTTWNGQQIIFGTEGQPVAFEAEATDPGSDDLTFAWTYGDGGTDTNVHLVNPPATDPATSPSNQPRDVTDEAPHTYAMACANTVGLTVTDDDDGSDSDSAQVIILGTSTDAGTLGVWQTDFRDKRSKLHTTAEKNCLLSIVRVLSSEFSERVALNTIADATKVLYPKSTNNANDQFDAMLLSLWLNVADGSIKLSDGVDTDGDGTNDSTVGAVIQAGEALRLSANPSRSELLRYKDLYAAINAAH